MKPFYHYATTNFGDHMNGWLWPQLIPELLDEDLDTRLIGIGSLLSRNLDLVAGKKVIFGTGSGYSSPPTPEQAAAWTIYCVRGPLTARLLGLTPELAITDAAWLINQVPAFAEPKPASARHGTVFLPHWTTDRFGAWAKVCPEIGFDYVSPFAKETEVFEALARAKLVVAESLHAAILADYFRTPWIPVASPGRVLTFKWLDWCQSLELTYAPYELPVSDYVDALFQRRAPRKIAQQFDGTPQALEVDTDPASWDIVRTPPPATRVTPTYRLKQAVKPIARTARDSGLKGLSAIRHQAVFAPWNRKHHRALKDWAAALTATDPYLSDDAVRADRIAKLNTALEKMKADFGA